MTSNPRKWKIGAVSYLNTLPLVFGLDPEHQDYALEFDLPSRLADRLSCGALDVALIPSIETFQNDGYKVVSNACIACNGPVWSVKLLSRVPLDSIASLALDEGSRTSISLVQILLARQFNVTPTLVPLPINSAWQESDADAVLIIGDRAMTPAEGSGFGIEVDLGQWWRELTDLPFVFALWTARPGLAETELNQLDNLLTTSRDLGLQEASNIAAVNAARYDLTQKQCLDYFQSFLHFQLGEKEKRALRVFRESAARMNFAPNNLELSFHDF